MRKRSMQSPALYLPLRHNMEAMQGSDADMSYRYNNGAGTPIFTSKYGGIERRMQGLVWDDATKEFHVLFNPCSLININPREITLAWWHCPAYAGDDGVDKLYVVITPYNANPSSYLSIQSTGGKLQAEMSNDGEGVTGGMAQANIPAWPAYQAQMISVVWSLNAIKLFVNGDLLAEDTSVFGGGGSAVAPVLFFGSLHAYLGMWKTPTGLTGDLMVWDKAYHNEMWHKALYERTKGLHGKA